MIDLITSILIALGSGSDSHQWKQIKTGEDGTVLIISPYDCTYSFEPEPITQSVSARFIATPFQQNLAEKTWLDWIVAQKQSIHLNAYGFTDQLTANALIAAKNRDVDVVLTMDSTEAGTKTQKRLVKELRSAAILVYIGKSPVRSQLLHAKLAIGDGKNVVLGSWNFSPSASEQFNDLVFIDNSESVSAYYDSFWQNIRDHLINKGITGK